MNLLLKFLFTEISQSIVKDIAQAKLSKADGDETQIKNKLLNNINKRDSSNDLANISMIKI